MTSEFRPHLRAGHEAWPAQREIGLIEVPDGIATAHHGNRYMPRPRGLPWRRSKAGLDFLDSIHFGEWLLPKDAAINSWHLGSMHSVPDQLVFGPEVEWDNRIAASRDRFNPASTGGYKGMRIGFRLVYELA